MSLRDEIAAVLSRDHGLTRRQRFAIPTTADAILALVRAHLTSDEAVGQAMHKSRVAWPGRSDAEIMRLALAAALGEGE